MQYNSITFLFHFLPLFLAAYYFLPAKLRNVTLVFGCLVFYYLSVKSKGIYKKATRKNKKVKQSQIYT